MMKSRYSQPFALFFSMTAILAGWFLTLHTPWDRVEAQEKTTFPPPARGADYPLAHEFLDVDLLRQTAAEAVAKSTGCLSCHHEAHDPHEKETVRLGCID